MYYILQFHSPIILLFKKNNKRKNSFVEYIDKKIVTWLDYSKCNLEAKHTFLLISWCWQLRYITGVEWQNKCWWVVVQCSGCTHPVTGCTRANGNDGLTATHRKRVRTRQWFLLSQRLKYRHQHGHQLFSCGRHSPSRITLASRRLQTASQGFSTYTPFHTYASYLITPMPTSSHGYFKYFRNEQQFHYSIVPNKLSNICIRMKKRYKINLNLRIFQKFWNSTQVF